MITPKYNKLTPNSKLLITNSKLPFTNSKRAFLIPVIIFAACIIISLTIKIKPDHSLLSNAILGDLIITAPLLYFIAIRKTTISKKSVLRVIIIGLLIAGLLLNTHSTPLLHFIKLWISPLLELTAIIFIVRKFYQINKSADLNGMPKGDFLKTSRFMMTQLLGSEKGGALLGSEVAVIYYAFFSRKVRPDQRTIFSSYKENGILTVLGAILFIFIIETAGMHFLFSRRNLTAAWILTGLSIYTCIQLYAHIRAVKARPILITEKSLEIRNGLAGDATIAWNNIERIVHSKKVPDRSGVKISLLKGMENHNMIIYLKEPITVTKIFGIKKKTDTVLFFVDHADELIKRSASFIGGIGN